MAAANQIKKIHALKGALGLDDDNYRLILSGYGVKSSTRLSIPRAQELIDDLQAKAVAAGVWEKRCTSRRSGDDPQSRKIRALWFGLHAAGKVRDPSDRAMLAYVKRMTGKSALPWCTVDEKNRLIEALKLWGER